MELRLTLRRLLRQPAPTSAVVLALAVALTMVSALSSIVDGLLFRPLPFKDADRLVAVEYRPQGGRAPELAWLPELQDRRDSLRIRLESSPLVAGASQVGTAAFLPRDEERDLGLDVVGVDARFFALFGLSPAFGRTLDAEDERNPAVRSRESREPLPVIIGHALWLRLYGGDPRALGIHELGGRPVRIIGVMGPGVKFPGETNVWAPVSSLRPRLPAYLRLNPGATLEQMESAFPELVFTPLRDVVQPGRAEGIVLLFGAVVALLIVTFVQAAALMFSQWMRDLREIGIRLALGARRTSIAKQFALASALTVGAALVLAWLAVAPATALVVRALPSELRHGQYLKPDVRTLLFVCSVALLGFVVLTLAPFALVRRARPLELLGGRALGPAFRVERVRKLLLFLQLSLTCFLLYLAGLASRSFLEARTFDYGFDAERVLVFTPPQWARPNRTTSQLFADYAERNRKVVLSVEQLRHVPGVVSAATFAAAPLAVGLTEYTESITHYNSRPLAHTVARINSVGPDFVRALGATLISGQTFDRPEFAGRPDVAVVNETLARRLSPPLTVMGQAVEVPVVGRAIQGERFKATIVGVIHDLVDSGPAVPADPQVFLPSWHGSAAFGIAIRVDASLEDALPAIHGTLEGVWGKLPGRQFSRMSDELRTVLVPFRAQAVLLGLVTACCLPIAAIGFLGALGHSVQVRSREIAIRIAVGGDPAAVRRSVIREALIIVAVAILAGTALGAATGSVVAHQLFQVRPVDAPTVMAVTIGFLVLGGLAAMVPAGRASRIEPMEVLRTD